MSTERAAAITGPVAVADGGGPLTGRLLQELLADGHRYVPGLEPWMAVLPESGDEHAQATGTLRERTRDRIERLAARYGYSRAHFDSRVAAGQLARILELLDGFEITYARLGDERSRRALVDLLKLRVLGPRHAPLRVSAQEFRDRQRHVDRSFRVQSHTIATGDPMFPELAEYRMPVGDGVTINVHAHSVDLVCVYLLGQYDYPHAEPPVTVGPDDVVLDVGACWGDTALYFAHLVGPRGKVFAFEVDPDNLAILRRNLELNPALAGRIEIVQRALWDSSGDTLTFTGGGRMTTVGQPSAGASATVTTTTLDDFVREAGLDRVGFVKMDIEGSERAALRGARGTLERLRPRLAIAAYHQDDDLVALPAAIDEHAPGYRFFVDSFSAVEAETVLFGSSAT